MAEPHNEAPKEGMDSARDRYKMKGGMVLPLPCDNVDEPKAPVRAAEP
jgi:hypothetical protein